MSNVRLELVWPNKDKFLLSPQDENGKPVWVDRTHPAAREVRLTEFTEAVGEVSNEHPESDNLLFVGDSLDALRILNETPAFRREYRGKVKLIYIDPPYNTGSTFTHYDDWMDHSTWLSFMRERLVLMFDLLAPDGSIWVQLDDVESHRMRLLLDEVFGIQNYVTNFVWRKVDSPNDNKVVVTPDHENILVYAKQPGASLGWTRMSSEAILDAYGQIDEVTGRRCRDRLLRKNGKGSLRSDRPTMWFPITDPDGNDIYPLHDDGRESRWAYGQAAVQEMVDNRTLVWKRRFSPFHAKDVWVPYTREFAPDVPTRPWMTIWSDLPTSRQSKAHLKTLFPGVEQFATPKPEPLMERILAIATSEGDVVMDFFGGSGTTAVVAHKMRRRWVTAEISSETVATFAKPRLSMAVNGDDVGGISQSVGWEGGGGFRVLEIQDTFYALTPLGVMLTDDASGPRFARAVAGQLGFDWEPTEGQLCGRRGRMRLAVLDGAVGVEEARQAVAELADDERVTIVARVILPGTEEWLAENSRGSLCLKAPNDVLRERRKRRRSNGGGA